ncbi:hypothetical protein BDR07DRAFT_1424397 [Suillus spraguei]|nr:hypothetical protein BDR07DRAFT_1424397 [Suillus spraguei]
MEQTWIWQSRFSKISCHQHLHDVRIAARQFICENAKRLCEGTMRISIFSGVIVLAPSWITIAISSSASVSASVTRSPNLPREFSAALAVQGLCLIRSTCIKPRTTLMGSSRVPKAL